jgi:hypothetical protein
LPVGLLLACVVVLLSDIHSGTNSAVDHLETIVSFLDTGVLTRGDCLIMDNCRIHNAAEIFPLLSLLIDAVGVRLFFLPRYSPEVSSELASGLRLIQCAV